LAIFGAKDQAIHQGIRQSDDIFGCPGQSAHGLSSFCSLEQVPHASFPGIPAVTIWVSENGKKLKKSAKNGGIIFMKMMINIDHGRFLHDFIG